MGLTQMSISLIIIYNKILEFFKNYGLQMMACILLIIFYREIKNFIADKFNIIIEKTLSSNKELKSFVNSIIKIMIQFVILILILSLLGITLSKLAAILGAVSLILGFAFKEVLSNFFGGIIILVFKPFLIGDVVEYSGELGTVHKIELFYTTLINFNNEYIIMPNGNLIHCEIKNVNKNETRRLDLMIGVGYTSDIDEVKQTIINIIENEETGMFSKDIEPVIGMNDIGSSSLNIAIKVHVIPKYYLDARYYLNEQIKTIFDQKNIDLPFNIVDLQINPEFNQIKLNRD